MTEAKPTHEEIEAFKAPKAKFGQPVAYYINGVKDTSRKPELGWVIRTGERTIHLYVVSATGGTLVRESVRHIDDPKLQLNADQRESGAWDFTDYDKEQTALRDEMNDRFDAIEKAVVAGPTQCDREVLLFHCKKLGLRGYSKLKSDVLREVLMKKRSNLLEDDNVSDYVLDADK